MKIFLLFSVLFTTSTAFAGTFKCTEFELSPACKAYLAVKTKDQTSAESEHPEMETCDDFLHTDSVEGNYPERRCNFCQVVSDLEEFGDESQIPNLGWFNEFRPQFEVTDETDKSCDQ